MQLTIEIKNEQLADKIVKLLNIFREEGVEIIEYRKNRNKQPQGEENWREVGMRTHSVDRDDDAYLYEAAWEFYNEKHSH